MIMMGALSKVTGAVKLQDLDTILPSYFSSNKRSLIEINIAAVEEGKKVVA